MKRPRILGAAMPHQHGPPEDPCFLAGGPVVRAYRIEHQDQRVGAWLWETDGTAIAALHKLVTTERRRELADRAAGVIQWPCDPEWVVPMTNGGMGFRLAMELFTCQPVVDVVNALLHRQICQSEQDYYAWTLATPDYWWHDDQGRRVRPQRHLREMPPTIDQALECHPLWQCWQDRLAYQRLEPLFLI